MWEFREPGSVDMTGFSVEATDGSIGKVDNASNETGGSYLIVDTGPLIFGKQVMLPAGVIDRVDPDAGTVHVGCTKQQLKDAPEYGDETMRHDQEYRGRLAEYYAGHRRAAPHRDPNGRCGERGTQA